MSLVRVPQVKKIKNFNAAFDNKVAVRSWSNLKLTYLERQFNFTKFILRLEC